MFYSNRYFAISYDWNPRRWFRLCYYARYPRAFLFGPFYIRIGKYL